MKTSKHAHSLARMRSIGAAVTLAGIVLIGCSEDSKSASTALVNTWKQAGLAPTVFLPLEIESLQPGTCQQGKIDDVETVLCTYADEAAARAAQPAGLAHVGEHTGFALTAGKHLLIVADRDAADPTGRKLNQIAAVFRKHHEAAKAAARGATKADGGKQGKKKGDGKAAGKPNRGS